MKKLKKNKSSLPKILKKENNDSAGFFAGIQKCVDIIVPSKAGNVSRACARKGINGASRFFEIDFLRGTAALMMVLFHFLWDTNFFGYTNISLYAGFWGIFQKITAGTFLFLVGVSLAISHGRKKENSGKKFFLRSAKIFALGLLLTAFSLAFFPGEPIFFGVLHLIAVSILLSIFFVGKKKSNFAFGILAIFLPLAFNMQSINFPVLFWLGIGQSGPALDFFPVIPWFGAVLLGLFFGNTFYENAEPKIKLQKPDSKAVDLVCFIGKNSLLIYFIHQPVLFLGVWIIKLLTAGWFIQMFAFLPLIQLPFAI